MPGASFMSLDGGKPVYGNGKWSLQKLDDLYLDRDGVEQFKTHFCKLICWDVNSGWATRKTLEGLGLKKIADAMAVKSRLGA